MASSVITGLFHVAIKTGDLDRSIFFYRDVMGLSEAQRPDFGYPGAWLTIPTPGGASIIHLYAGGPALGPDGVAPVGTGAIDHISLSAFGYHSFCDRIRKAGLDWREFSVPGTTLWQIFVYDPNGVQLEITFDGRAENGPEPDQSIARRYRAGESFFDPARYSALVAR
jgi:catechol 2,3-dioxygenase-like lactoylglutathione lyase family enzyme